MQGHQIIALTLSVAVLAGCRTERPVTAPVPVAAPESAVQGTVVGDDRTAMEAAGFIYRHARGLDIFLDSPDAKPREAVHIIFANEKVKPREPVVGGHPNIPVVREP